MKKIAVLFLIAFIMYGCSSTPQKTKWYSVTKVVEKQKKIQIGDILIKASGVSLYSWYGHCSIYIGGGMVAEIPCIGSKILFTPLIEWRYYHKKITVLRYKNNLTQKQKNKILSIIEKNRNKKYGLSLNKNSDENYYCSQLIWSIYKKIGINIDIENKYTVYVLPYDYLYSKNLKTISF